MKPSRCTRSILVHEHAISPLMELLGQRGSQHCGGIAEEHYFSNCLRNELGAARPAPS